ncbi:MAG: protein kinase domain-containing protein [Ktedonobacteraceae bacterium]
MGNYRLVRILGRGGFAEVYLGQHIRLNTLAAIKILHTQLIDKDAEGFLLEAQTIAALIHPHVVRVFDFDVQDSIPFLVMDYASNGSLRSLHPKGVRLPLGTVISYVQQIADALQYAHDQNLIHRDIKPENMLVGHNQEILISDFGLAVIAQTTSSQSIQEMAGTVPYTAPEQLQGKPRKSSDQYSLGIVVYEWLCGEHPFRGSALEIITQHLLKPPPSLRAKNPHISLAIELVVLKALAKDPQQRYTNVYEFANALYQAYQAEWGGSSTFQERIEAASRNHSDQGNSDIIFWTHVASDPHFIKQAKENDTSDKPMVIADHILLQTFPDSIFLFNQPLLDPTEFYGRRRERTTLLNRTRNGASSSIVGPRRIGKTWLMSYLKLVAQKELGTRYVIGYLDATTARCTTIAGFTASTIEALGLQRRSLSSDEGLVLLEHVLQELISVNRLPVLCVDEFEGFSNREVFDLSFFSALRAMTQNGLCLIVASKSPLIDIVGDIGKTSGFFNVFEQIKMKPFTTKDAERFSEDKASQAGFTDQERTRLLQYGQFDDAYWPLRLQLVGKMLLEDKVLAALEQDQDYYHPEDPTYWQEFERRLEETYRGAVH